VYFTKCYSGDEVKENKMNGHVARMGGGEGLVGNCNERDQLEDLKVDGSLILK
jgi:hypothetical protein